MRRLRFCLRLFLPLFMLVVYGSLSSTSYASVTRASPQAIRYLNEALDYIQTNSVKTKTVDWSMLRQKAKALAEDAQTTADTYPAIKMVLQHLGDHHSFFLNPSNVELADQGQNAGFGFTLSFSNTVVKVIPQSPADRGGLRERDAILAINGVSIVTMSQDAIGKALYEGSQVTLTARHPDDASSVVLTLVAANYDDYMPPVAQRLSGDIGYLELPTGGGATPQQQKDYATEGQSGIRQVDQQATCGWIIDLRRNEGGGIYPMLAAVGPLLGEGNVGGFVDANGNRQIWSYHNGKVYLGNQLAVTVDHPYHLQHAMPPVAILTSDLTASAAEATLVAFQGRSHIRSFGMPTYGVPTGNNEHMLSDGAELILTSALDMDRTGRAYDAPLNPDQNVQIDWAQLNTHHDPVLQAAEQWLQSQSCH